MAEYSRTIRRTRWASSTEDLIQAISRVTEAVRKLAPDDPDFHLEPDPDDVTQCRIDVDYPPRAASAMSIDELRGFLDRERRLASIDEISIDIDRSFSSVQVRIRIRRSLPPALRATISGGIETDVEGVANVTETELTRRRPLPLAVVSVILGIFGLATIVGLDAWVTSQDFSPGTSTALSGLIVAAGFLLPLIVYRLATPTLQLVRGGARTRGLLVLAAIWAIVGGTIINAISNFVTRLWQ